MPRSLIALALVAFISPAWGDDASVAPADSKETTALRWSFDGAEEDARTAATGTVELKGTPQGKPKFGVPGPRPSAYPDFAPTNTALRLPAGANYLAIDDPGENSVLDFTNGDAITLEAWVRWDEPLKGTYPYLIGKGRTHSGAGTRHNHNYSLRLANGAKGVFPSFMFADAESAAKNPPDDKDWHRWTASEGVAEDGDWHHVAVTYEFGHPDSIRGYVDGRAVKGAWEAGGKTEKPPVVDNDQLWIGSSMGGSSTFTGEMDELALHRAALTADEIKSRVKINIQAFGDAVGKADPASFPADRVRVEIVDRLPVARSWQFRVREPSLVYETDVFALKELPRKYDAKALITERQVPLLVHMGSQITLPEGEYEFLVRSLDSARLYVDGQLLTETPFMSLQSSAHGKYYHLTDPGPGLLSVAAGHSEKRATVKLPAGSHQISLYRLIGNKGRSAYPGETCVGIGPPGGPYRFLSPTRELPFTDDGWLSFIDEDEERLRVWEQNLRAHADGDEDAYWAKRHAFAAANAGPEIPVPAAKGADAAGEIDRFVAAKLAEEQIQATPLVDDYAFLRRVTLDTLGVIPTQPQIAAYFADPPATRRQQVIDRLLADRGWADHWVGYWQDVLAENPGLTKPELNNSGPFRWFLYESFLDGKPIDRLVTELVMMEGDPYLGGPAGFAIASQNDVPMASKAHILGVAFLGVEMKCARCHDAPDHDVLQQDLFAMAAMLKRGPQNVPGTSSIPVTPEQLARMTVKVTLKPGSSVKPDWPFVEFVSYGGKGAASSAVLPPELLRNTEDSRELLAAQITSPHNSRFAKVLMNRVWARYLGRGLTDPVDDWESAECSNPELLDWLAREFVTHGYDLKHVARLILNSDTYQRTALSVDASPREAALFAGPARRRMTGEQITDSLYLAAGKDYASEELTMDRDGTQTLSNFIHLRYPRRAWQFVAVANERDRPSLNLPVAQSVIDMLAAYGWRQQRQDPLTLREDALTPLQPMAMAHGTAAAKAMDFSDGSAFTQLALENQPVDQLVERLFLQLLTRPPTSAEREAVKALLAPGYDGRVVAGPEAVPARRVVRSGVTWSNHFAPESDEEAIARQREVLNGDAPSARLDPDWRARAEDAVWALANLPEFVFAP
jgi:hypothetical protein